VAKEWFIWLKRRVQGFDPDEDPKYPAIGRSLKHLDALARAQGWQPLTSFLSEDQDVAIDLLDEEDEEEVEAIIKNLGKVRWFRPEDALAIVQLLVEAIEQVPRRLPLQPQNRARVLTELTELQQTLQRLIEHSVVFRFYAEFG
jgi:hypothetical protein